MRERELANLIVQIGLDQGVSVEQIAQEVAAMRLPSFIDGQAWRDAIVEAVEAQLRARVEEQIAELRRRMGLPQPVQGRVQMPSMEPSPAAAETVMPNSEPVAVPPAAPVARDPDLPSDATMFWSKRSEGQD